MPMAAKADTAAAQRKVLPKLPRAVMQRAANQPKAKAKAVGCNMA